MCSSQSGLRLSGGGGVNQMPHHSFAKINGRGHITRWGAYIGGTSNNNNDIFYSSKMSITSSAKMC